MDADEMLARLGTDGLKWTEEFVRAFDGETVFVCAGKANVDNILGWFCNAIEAGRTAGREEVGCCCSCPDSDVARLAHEALTVCGEDDCRRGSFSMEGLVKLAEALLDGPVNSVEVPGPALGSPTDLLGPPGCYTTEPVSEATCDGSHKACEGCAAKRPAMRPVCGRCYDEVDAVFPANCAEKPEARSVGAMGQYHCPDCGAMVLAGLEHQRLCQRCLDRKHPRFDREE